MARTPFSGIEDAAIRAHLESLRDEVTGDSIEHSTKLIKLQQDDRLLNELTRPGTLIPCSLTLPDGKTYPRTKRRSINLYITYNRLVSATGSFCISLH